MNDNTRTDEQGIRYFCDHNGSRVNYPATTRFGDGYQQPAIEGVTVWKSAGISPDDNTTPTPHTLSNFRVEYVKPDYSRGHSFEPRCAILADDAEFDGKTVRVFDVPDPDESQREIAQFACDAMNEHGRLIEALNQIRVWLISPATDTENVEEMRGVVKRALERVPKQETPNTGGDDDDGPMRVPCYMCGKPTTIDTAYGNLCYRCCRADNE